MPKFLSVLTVAIVLSACAALVIAQETTPPEKLLAVSATSGEQATDGNKPDEASGSTKPSEKPGTKPGAAAALPSGEVSPTPTPKPKRSWFSWLFGPHKKEATPSPAVTPGPTPTPAGHKTPRHRTATPEPQILTSPEEPSTPPKHGKVTPTPKPTPTPKKTERPPHGTKAGATPKPDASTPAAKPDKVSPVTPAPSVTAPVATPAPRKTPKPKATPATSANTAPIEGGDPDAQEKARFEAAKAKAQDDPKVKSLKDKADQATTDEESRAALRAYNKELFEKVKKIDSGVSDFADQLEKAILKRLGE